MFQEKEMVIYGCHGVCEVERIGRLNLPMIDRNREYYTLQPRGKKTALIYAPVENNKTMMRKVLTKEEARELLTHVPHLEMVWIGSEKDRESCYKEALKTCDCAKLIGIIKTLYLRKKQRMEDGKKPTAIDEKYFSLAEEQLYGELSFVLELDKKEIQEQISWE